MLSKIVLFYLSICHAKKQEIDHYDFRIDKNGKVTDVTDQSSHAIKMRQYSKSACLPHKNWTLEGDDCCASPGHGKCKSGYTYKEGYKCAYMPKRGNAAFGSEKDVENVDWWTTLCYKPEEDQTTANSLPDDND